MVHNEGGVTIDDTVFMKCTDKCVILVLELTRKTCSIELILATQFIKLEGLSMIIIIIYLCCEITYIHNYVHTYIHAYIYIHTHTHTYTPSVT